MTTRTYPYKAWILMPSFKPVEVSFVKAYSSFSGYDYGDITSAGKTCAVNDIHATKEAAMEVGHARLEALRGKIERMQLGHDKKLAALKKAAA